MEMDSLSACPHPVWKIKFKYQGSPEPLLPGNGRIWTHRLVHSILEVQTEDGEFCERRGDPAAAAEQTEGEGDSSKGRNTA